MEPHREGVPGRTHQKFRASSAPGLSQLETVLDFVCALNNLHNSDHSHGEASAPRHRCSPAGRRFLAQELERGVLKPGQWTDDTSMALCWHVEWIRRAIRRSVERPVTSCGMFQLSSPCSSFVGVCLASVFQNLLDPF